MATRSPHPPLDEAAAWSLVRSLPPLDGEDHRPVRLSLDPASGSGPSPRGEVRLHVHADGTWEATHPITAGARALLDLYLPLCLSPSLVIGQVGQSLDGRIATANGDSHFVTGTEDRRRLHRVRALVDAVVVGAGTAAADNPRLTVRLAEGPSPTRVILDPRDRLDSGLRVFTDGAAPTLVARPAGHASPAPGRAHLLPVPPRTPGDPFMNPRDILAALRERGLRRVLVEGGGVTVSHFLAAGALDRLHVSVAPVLFGSGRPSLALPPIDSLDQALRPGWRRFDLDPDLLFDLDLRSG